MNTLNRKQVFELIKAVGTERTVLVQGTHGSGKTALLYDLAADAAFAGHHVVNPVDCTQLSDGSVWVPDLDREAGVSRELPNDRWGVSSTNRKGVDGSQPVLLCLDEIAKARQSIKDTLAPIIYERRIGDYHMPTGSVIFACTNLSTEGLGDTMQAHLRDRLITVTMRNPTAGEWIDDFAIPHSLHPAVIACVTEYPQVFESFTDYEVDGPKAKQDIARSNPYIFNPRAMQEKWVTPRSLHAASDLLHRGGGLDEATLETALAGTVGRAFAALLIQFIRFGKSLPAFADICARPQQVPVPSNPGALIVLVFKLITQTRDAEQAEAVSQFISRFPGESKLLFVSNVSKNSTRMGLFARSATFTQTLTKSLKILNA
jgi:hypothetical protein